MGQGDRTTTSTEPGASSPGASAASSGPRPSPPDGDPPADLEELTEGAAADLGTDRVGVWVLEEDGRVLRRVHLHERPSGAHRGGGLLEADRFPAYFRALREEGELAVSRVEDDGRVRELLTPYARPLGIASWLDVPIPGGSGETAGLLRLEHRGDPRVWTEGDRERARRAASGAAEALGMRAAGDGAVSAETARGGDRPPEDPLRAAAVDRNPAGIAVLDIDGTVLRSNGALAEALGHPSAEELRGTDLVRTHYASEQAWGELLDRLESEERVTDHEVELRATGAERTRWFLQAAALLPAEGPGPPRVLITAVDATSRKEREERLRHQAYRDPLTDLANRRLLREAAEQALALADRHGRKAGLLYLDLSRFKQVNDTYGHDVGDLVLRAVADRLRDLMRESDLAARVGGDEFAVLLPEVDDEAGALRAGRRLLDDIDRPVSVGEQEVRVAGKAGAALYPDHARDLDGLVEKADEAMYRAREREDRRVVVHGEREAGEEETGNGASSPAAGRGDSGDADAAGNGAGGTDADGAEAAALRGALGRGELALHYQPIVRRVGEDVPGAEALLRWEHPERGLLEAGAFLPAAREADLLPEIDRWVLERAVERARLWAAADLDRWVAVNVAAETLAGRGLPAFLDDLVVSSGLRRDRLLIEATLTPDEPDLEVALPTLRNLRAKSFRVALDYSGPGEELAAAFQEAPVDVVKMDHAVLDVLSPESVAELLDAAVLVKRVETERDYDDVTGRGVPLLQGFYSGRPVPAEDLDEGT